MLSMMLSADGRYGVMMGKRTTGVIKLPEPVFEGGVSVERALLKRRSVRTFQDESLTLGEVSQILWAAQGVTNPRGFRTAPSAGALFPLEIYVAIGNVNDLSPGVYRYIPLEHELEQVEIGDKRDQLSKAALGQSPVANAPVVFIICAVYERTTGKYGERGIRYVFMEAGHVSQNIYLQAASLNMGTVAIGAFRDPEIKDLINCKPNEHPLYIMPLGK